MLFNINYNSFQAAPRRPISTAGGRLSASATMYYYVSARKGAVVRKGVELQSSIAGIIEPGTRVVAAAGIVEVRDSFFLFISLFLPSSRGPDRSRI